MALQMVSRCTATATATPASSELIRSNACAMLRRSSDMERGLRVSVIRCPRSSIPSADYTDLRRLEKQERFYNVRVQPQSPAYSFITAMDKQADSCRSRQYSRWYR